MTQETHTNPVTCWSVHELAFTARNRPGWHTFPLAITFEHASGSFSLDGYWDGEQTWRVRFALPRPGEWRWRTASADSGLDGHSGLLIAEAPSPAEVAANPNYRGHIRISDNGRYFTYADGAPFLYLGDTCWHINEARCGLGQKQDGPFYIWLRDRKQKNFTVVHHWLFASGHPESDQEIPSANEGGQAFAVENGRYLFDKPNPAYYRYVDRRWQALWDNGFVMGGPPTWFAKPRRGMTLEQGQRISRYVMARYGAFNLVWALTGEYSFGQALNNPPWDRVETWYALGRFVAGHNPYHHPISIHPGPATYHVSSSQDFQRQSWLDHHWLQTGQYPAGLHRVAVWAGANYKESPTRPVIHAEGFYEGEPAGGSATEYQVRYQAWSALLNGACGAVYGANGIWTFRDDADPRSYAYKDDLQWPQALALPGSRQIGYIADFFQKLDWWRLGPRRELLLVNGQPVPWPEENSIWPPHCAEQAGRNCVIYIPAGNQANTITVAKLPGPVCLGRWYDPRQGRYRPFNQNRPLETEANGQYTLPPRPDPANGDWVCLITVEE